MQESRNDEKVVEIKKERRSKNYIIHGLEENGEDPFLNVLLKKTYDLHCFISNKTCVQIFADK